MSCHGELVKSTERDVQHLIFHVRDGRKASSEVFPHHIKSQLVILSACNSGVYSVAYGDYPEGAAPELIRAEAQYCVGARYPVGAAFAAEFMKVFAKQLSSCKDVALAFASAIEDLQAGYDFWKDIACFELIARS